MKNIFFFACLFLLVSCSKKSGDSAQSGNSKGGSLARFTIIGNYLYTINQQTLKTYDITSPDNPVLKSEVNVGPAIQTIYPFKNYLFIGSAEAMYIFDLSNPAKPSSTSIVSYVIRASDPVVTNDSVAFTTLRNTQGQGGTLNIIDVRQVTNPATSGSLRMDEPYGLGLSDNILYVCEGINGLKVFNIDNCLQTRSINLIKTLQNSDFYYDVIPFENRLYAYIKEGFSIFDISQQDNPVMLSRTTH